MQKIKINGARYSIPSISELTFYQFNEIIVKGQVTTFAEYISIFIDLPMDELMKSEFSGASLPSLNQLLFNVDIDSVMSEEKKTVKYNDINYAMSDLSPGTFGKNYYFDLFHGSQRNGRINYYELCIYALATGLAKENAGMIEINEIGVKLGLMNWMEVLPQGFFLAKKYSKSRKISIKWWLNCILPLKVTKWKMKLYGRKLIIRERI